MSFLAKTVIVGDINSGKEIIIRKYLREGNSDNSKFTIGVDFALREIKVNEKIVKIQLWDLHMEARDKILANNYYYGSYGGILVFDVLKREALDRLEDWSKEIWENSGRGVIPLVIFGINAENRDQAVNSVTEKEGMRIASAISSKAKQKGYEIPYYEVSSTMEENIEAGLEFLAKAFLLFRYPEQLKDSNNQPKFLLAKKK